MALSTLINQWKQGLMVDLVYRERGKEMASIVPFITCAKKPLDSYPLMRKCTSKVYTNKTKLHSSSSPSACWWTFPCVP